MSNHIPYVQNTMDYDCAVSQCGHEDDCPNTPTVLCQACAELSPVSEDGEQWFGKEHMWPCSYTTITGQEDSIIAGLLAKEASVD